jgi:hypothetical protein
VTSFALSGVVDIDIHPDYDAFGMSVMMWSSYSSVLQVRHARGARPATFVSNGNRTIHLAGPPSEIATVLRHATIAYTPRERITGAFTDTIRLRIAVGLVPVISCENLPPDVRCVFRTTAYALPCESSSPITTPCLIKRTIYVPVGDSPSYIAHVARARGSHRTIASRRRAVFLIWFVFSFLIASLASRLKRAFCTICVPSAPSSPPSSARDVRVFSRVAARSPRSLVRYS